MSNIYKRMEICRNVLQYKIKTDKIYGFALLNALYEVVENVFSDLDSNKQDIVIMRIYDMLERDKDCAKFHF